VQAAVAAFQRVRKAAVGTAQKPPTTSELIDWVKILHWRKIEPALLTGEDQKPGNETLLPPYWEMLFKNTADLDAHQTLADARQKQATKLTEKAS
jgi:hypothetical protein